MSAPNGCNGTCCVAFNLPHTHAQIADPDYKVNDNDFVKDMLIPLTPDEARERMDDFAVNLQDFEFDPPDDADNLYTCRHWNTETRLCMAYEDRPTLCRDYPYEKSCHACDYTPEPDVVEHWIEIRLQRNIKNEVEE